MNNNFPPLYPQEAYLEQNNTNAFVNNKNSAYFESGTGRTPQQSSQNPLAGLLGGLSGSNNFSSALLPLLIKALSGGGVNALAEDTSKNLDNPLMGILSSFGGNKKSPPNNVGEKQFPD